MKQKSFKLLFTTLFVITTLFFLFSQNVFAKIRIVFSGGPAGGTFQVVANAIQVYKPIKELKDYKIQAQSSGGSVENLRKINSGKAHFGVVYSGHIWLGSNGKMKKDKKEYKDVLAVSYLYGAPAQLVVKKAQVLRA